MNHNELAVIPAKAGIPCENTEALAMPNEFPPARVLQNGAGDEPSVFIGVGQEQPVIEGIHQERQGFRRL